MPGKVIVLNSKCHPYNRLRLTKQSVVVLVKWWYVWSEMENTVHVKSCTHMWKMKMYPQKLIIMSWPFSSYENVGECEDWLYCTGPFSHTFIVSLLFWALISLYRVDALDCCNYCTFFLTSDVSSSSLAKWRTQNYVTIQMGLAEGYDGIWLGHNNPFCSTLFYFYFSPPLFWPDLGTNVRKVMVLDNDDDLYVGAITVISSLELFVMENLCIVITVLFIGLRYSLLNQASCLLFFHCLVTGEWIRGLGTMGHKSLFSQLATVNHDWITCGFERQHISPSAFSCFIDSYTGDLVILLLAEGLNCCVL